MTIPEKIPTQIHDLQVITVYQDYSLTRSKEKNRKNHLRYCFIILIILQTPISFSFSSTNDDKVEYARHSARRDKKSVDFGYYYTRNTEHVPKRARDHN